MDVSDPGIELGSPALQADSLPTELSGEPGHVIVLHLLSLTMSFFNFKMGIISSEIFVEIKENEVCVVPGIISGM